MKRLSEILAFALIGVCIVFGVYQYASALPSGKVAFSAAANRYDIQNIHPRMSIVDGAAANANIGVSGLTSSDIVLSVIYVDTVAPPTNSSDYTDSTYWGTGDSIKCGLATGDGYLLILWHDVVW